MEKEIIKEYSNGEITVIWKAHLCIHSGNCVKLLPKVYNPKESPWIKVENATTNELKEQIKQCPSGALSYYMNEKENKKTDNSNSKIDSIETKIEIMENGPLLIYGTLRIEDKDGKITKKNKTTAFCRCGHSKNKPFCDGTHTDINFEG